MGPVGTTQAKEKYNDDYYRILEEELGVLPVLAEYNNQPHVEGKSRMLKMGLQTYF